MNGIMKYINRIARSNEVVYANRLRGYGITQSHKHLPEMQVRCGLSCPPVFSPLWTTITRVWPPPYPCTCLSCGV